MNPVNWHETTTIPSLSEGNVHVWRASIETAPPDAHEVLDRAEQDRLRRIQIPAARTAFIASRFFVRKLLARYLDIDPTTITFGTTSAGKPYICQPLTRLAFNLSHSHGLALLAIGHQTLGLDVEQLRPIHDALRIARRIFPSATVTSLERMDEPARSLAFLNHWTQFEARQKALGRGMFAAPATGLTNHLVFRAAATYVGTLAWLRRDNEPKVSWFLTDISS